MTEPSQTDIAAMQGDCAAREFGAAWCGYCKAAQSLIAEALARHPEIRHIKIEDGKGRRLGRRLSGQIMADAGVAEEWG